MKQIVLLRDVISFGVEYKAGFVFTPDYIDNTGFAGCVDLSLGVFQNEYEEYSPQLENK